MKDDPLLYSSPLRTAAWLWNKSRSRREIHTGTKECVLVIEIHMRHGRWLPCSTEDFDSGDSLQSYVTTLRGSIKRGIVYHVRKIQKANGNLVFWLINFVFPPTGIRILPFNAFDAPRSRPFHLCTVPDFIHSRLLRTVIWVYFVPLWGYFSVYFREDFNFRFVSYTHSKIQSLTSISREKNFHHIDNENFTDYRVGKPQMWKIFGIIRPH